MNAGLRLLSMLVLGLTALLFTARSLGAADQTPAQAAPLVIQLAIDGPIGPATTDFIRRGVATATERGAELIILRIDTPGGLAAATRDIDQIILASPMPVIAWVAPSGARAASAGTYILYASHVAAMAPGTHLGAATPVPIGGGMPTPRRPLPNSDEEPDPTQPSGEDGASGMERKILHDSAAYIRSLAELRGRNAVWAERAVREGESLTADEALAQNVIELQAADIDSLLRQLHQREVKLGDKTLVLRTEGAQLQALEPDWRTQLLALITNPSVAYLLLLAGLYGLLLEGYNPGALVPGVVGVVCLLLAAYALQVLPVNYAGLALIIVGLLLIVAEVMSPSFGVLGIGGVVALVLGSLVLFDTDVPGFVVSRGLIGGIAALSGGGLLLLLYFLGSARSRPANSGSEAMLDREAIALEDFQDQGRVQVFGEVWRAHCEQPVHRGQTLRVQRVEGLTLHCRLPAETHKADRPGD